MTELRSKLIKACHDYLQIKVAVVKKAMDGLKEDMESESKSSAGDKFETGREMINIEWNKLSIQLNQYEQLRNILKRIEDQKPTGNAILGSVVKTDKENFFISIPAGEIKLDKENFYAVGIKAPVAQVLLGKKEGDEVIFNNREFRIDKII
ncbi:transcription elongation factor [Gramella lutea]|uniref:Transcription elongation factor n=1 Tax=Christiangramia lutea TaxID=1607951 RepID=A0A9X2A8K6_9FLAO|nr:transcription elongation factor [Christiangramia lutea]MCH4822400.1 transcription elongation factor [Christiangramia lutea]